MRKYKGIFYECDCGHFWVSCSGFQENCWECGDLVIPVERVKEDILYEQQKKEIEAMRKETDMGTLHYLNG